MNVINNLKKAQLEAPEKKLLYTRCVIHRHSAIVTRILNIFGKEPRIRKRNISLYQSIIIVILYSYMFSVWGVIMFATSVFLMDKYGNQLAI